MGKLVCPCDRHERPKDMGKLRLRTCLASGCGDEPDVVAEQRKEVLAALACAVGAGALLTNLVGG